MLTERIKYTDYNGVEREENFYFNLTEAELTEMEMGTVGGLTEMIKKITDTQDMPTIIKTFKEIILKSYGEKSADGKHFNKVDMDGRSLAIPFSQTEAFSQLYMKLASDPAYSATFFKGILPAKLQKEVDEKNKTENK